jgi:hypothetical protein
MAASVVPAAMLLWGVCVPGGYYSVIVTALVVWALVGVAWLVTSVRYVRTVQTPRRPAQLWPLAVVPVIFVATWVVASGDLPGRVAFAHNRAELERSADQQADAPSNQYRDVGPYSFESIGRGQGCVLYAIKKPAVAKAAGFAWCPGHVPVDDDSGDGEDYQRFQGDWYVFIVRHELWPNRYRGARPWGLQLTELQSRTEV